MGLSRWKVLEHEEPGREGVSQRLAGNHWPVRCQEAPVSKEGGRGR